MFLQLCTVYTVLNMFRTANCQFMFSVLSVGAMLTCLCVSADETVICCLLACVLFSLEMLVEPVKCINRHRCCYDCYDDWLICRLLEFNTTVRRSA